MFVQSLRSALLSGLDQAQSAGTDPQDVLNELVRIAAALSVANSGPLATAEALRDLADQIDREFSRGKH